MKSKNLLTFTCAALAAACGELPADDEVSTTLFSLEGNVDGPAAPVLDGDEPRVAMLWYRINPNQAGAFPHDESLAIGRSVAVEPVFPAGFRLDLDEAPPAEVVLTDDEHARLPVACDADDQACIDAPFVPWPADFRLAVGFPVLFLDHDADGEVDLGCETVLAFDASQAVVFLAGERPDDEVWVLDRDFLALAPDGYSRARLPTCGVLGGDCSPAGEVLDEDTPVTLTIGEGPVALGPEPPRRIDDYLVDGQVSADVPRVPWDSSLVSASPGGSRCVAEGVLFLMCQVEATCPDPQSADCVPVLLTLDDAANPPADWPCP